MDLYVCKTVGCVQLCQSDGSRKMPKSYLITLRTARVHLVRCWLGAVSMHQAQKSCAVFAQKFELSSLTEESPGKEGQEHFQMVLMTRR